MTWVRNFQVGCRLARVVRSKIEQNLGQLRNNIRCLIHSSPFVREATFARRKRIDGAKLFLPREIKVLLDRLFQLRAECYSKTTERCAQSSQSSLCKINSKGLALCTPANGLVQRMQRTNSNIPLPNHTIWGVSNFHPLICSLFCQLEDRGWELVQQDYALAPKPLGHMEVSGATRDDKLKTIWAFDEDDSQLIFENLECFLFAQGQRCIARGSNSQKKGITNRTRQ